MNYLEFSKKIAKDCLVFKTDYYALITQEGSKEKVSEADRKIIAHYVGSLLRNYYLLQKLCSFLFERSDNDIVSIVGTYFANESYVKKVPTEEALNFLTENLNDLKLDLTEDKKTILSAAIRERRNYKLPNVKNFGILSVKFNLPEWFIKMLIKHYGKDEGIKTCRLLNSKLPQHFYNNGLDKLALLSEDEKLRFKENSDGTFTFTGKSTYRKEDLFKNKKLIPIQLAYLDMIEKLPILKERNYSIYLGVKNYIYFPIVSKYLKDNNHATIITKALKDNYELLNFKKKYNIRSLYFQESEMNSLKAIISKPQDLFVVMSTSSEFDRLKNESDYAVTFNENNLDTLIENQLNDLECATEFINKNGYLVYCVNTLGLKETTNIRTNFLEKHAEFTLIEEKQYLPSEKDSLFYHAIFKKNND